MRTIECIIGPPHSEARKASQEFLVERALVQLMRRAFQFLACDIAALCGRKLEYRPMRLVLGGLVQIVKMVVAMRCSDEERPSLSVGERGAQHLGPRLRSHGSVLIHD